MFTVRKEHIPFNAPDITEAETNEVIRTLQSGWLAKGPKTLDFEQEFAWYVGAKYAVGLNSGTAALHLGLLAAGIGAGDEVITSPMTFTATAAAIVHTGATPVFADICEDTGCIDCDIIEKKITSKTRAILPVHYAGQVCDLDRIYKIAEKHGLYVLEDASHALGSTYKGRRIGRKLPGAAAFSFNASMNLCTGEGGMLVTDSVSLANIARTLSLHGLSRNAWSRYAQQGNWIYDVEAVGYKYSMFDIQAALGQAQLRRMDEMQAARQRIAKKYDDAFMGVKGLELPYIPTYAGHSRHLYILKINERRLRMSRNEFISELAARSVGASVHFIPLNYFTAYQKAYGYRIGDFPVSETHYSRCVSMPIYPGVEGEQQDYIISAVRDILTYSEGVEVTGE